MKDLAVLLVLLPLVQTVTVSLQPYRADSDGKCRNKSLEYLLDGSDLCCKKCPPGQRLYRKCSEFMDSDCNQCRPGLYNDNWNFHQNCHRCTKCQSNKGLQYAINCSPQNNAMCRCQPGMYCIMDFDDPYCKECRKYKMCQAGYGVVTTGTANSDVKCEQCLSGMFSDTASYTDPCQPHTICNDGALVSEGNATSDTLCETTKPKQDNQVVFTTPSALVNRVLVNPVSVVSHKLRSFTQSARPSVSEETFHPPTQSTPPPTKPGILLRQEIIGSIIGLTLLFIILGLLCFCKPIWRKVVARTHRNVDANGNIGQNNEVSQNYLGDSSQLTSITVPSTEQQYLLKKQDFGCDSSKTVTEAFPESDCNNRHESIRLFHFDSQHCACFERSLQSSPITELPSQPISQQVISPVTPHVNVNITMNMGNGSCGSPTFFPLISARENDKLPFGEEEKSFSMSQQEEGKLYSMSVQESISK